MIRTLKEWVGEESRMRIDADGNLVFESDECGVDMIAAHAHEVEELAAWLGQELARFKRFARQDVDD